MSLTHILYEAATGFNIFSINGKEGIAEFTDKVQQSYQNFSTLSKICKLIATVPFTSAENALENINSISEGILTELLHSFLKQTFPSSSGIVLGVSDNKLAASVQQELSIGCISDNQTAEMIRCIRFHINDYTKLKDTDLVKAQLGLGHSYSRSKVKFNVHKVDNMIIQAICLVDQINKDLNTFYMRIREWYSWHFPELIKIVPKNIHFARLVKLIQNKSSITAETLQEITNILEGNEALAQNVIQAAKSSMGTDISNVDLESILHFADRVISMEAYQRDLSQYLSKKMSLIAPNLQALVGDEVGAKLIARAGSLTNLAKYPASTVQILGAEKALFRAIKTKGKTPKYGLIYNSGFIANASNNKGRIARCLANKITIAARIDCFADVPTPKFGLVLKQQIQDRIKYFDHGVAPKRNLDVMREVISEVEKDFADLPSAMQVDKKEKKDDKKSSKKEEKKDEKKSSKKRSLEEVETPKEEKEEKKDDKKSKKSKKDESSKSSSSTKIADEMKVEKKEEKKEKKEKKEEKEDKKEKKEKKDKEDKKEKKEKKEDKKEKKEKKSSDDKKSKKSK